MQARCAIPLRSNPACTSSESPVANSFANLKQQTTSFLKNPREERSRALLAGNEQSWITDSTRDCEHYFHNIYTGWTSPQVHHSPANLYFFFSELSHVIKRPLFSDNETLDLDRHLDPNLSSFLLPSVLSLESTLPTADQPTTTPGYLPHH